MKSYRQHSGSRRHFSFDESDLSATLVFLYSVKILQMKLQTGRGWGASDAQALLKRLFAEPTTID